MSMRFNPLARLFTHIIPVLPVLRRIVLVLLREFTGYGAPDMRPKNPQPQQAEPELELEPLQQLLRQNELLVQALQRSRVRQRITLWISLAALLIACLLWFRVA